MIDYNPTITWKYYKDENYDDYEHFSIPFIINASILNRLYDKMGTLPNADLIEIKESFKNVTS